MNIAHDDVYIHPDAIHIHIQCMYSIYEDSFDISICLIWMIYLYAVNTAHADVYIHYVAMHIHTQCMYSIYENSFDISICIRMIFFYIV